MENLYSRLFPVRSVDRDRLEDYLTEIVADLLSRLPREDQLSFCRDFLMAKDTSVDPKPWVDRLERYPTLLWRTQEPVVVPGAKHQKRPDIVLYGAKDDEKHVLMVIECKIEARLTQSPIVAAPRQKPQILHQLGVYDRWLSVQAKGPAALVLLTHLSDPPAGFVQSDEAEYRYLTSLRCVRRYADFYKWLHEHSKHESWDSTLRFLANALLEFLREKELMSENPTLSDFAAARLYVGSGSHARIAGAMATARKAVQERHGKLKLVEFPKKPPVLTTEQGVGYISDFCRVGSPYIGWGILFLNEGSDAFDGYRPPVSILEGVYTLIEFAKPVSQPRGPLIQHWHFPTPEMDERFVYKIEPLRLPSSDFSVAFANWVTSSFEEARQIIARMRY